MLISTSCADLNFSFSACDHLLFSLKPHYRKMSFTSRNSNGEILTGKLWRMNLSFFNNLPFHSNIPTMDDISESLRGALDKGGEEDFCNALLLVRLYVHFPFNRYLKSSTEIWKGSRSGPPILRYPSRGHHFKGCGKNPPPKSGCCWGKTCWSYLGFHIQICHA